MPIYDVTITVDPTSATYSVEANSPIEAQGFLEDIFYTDIVEIRSKASISNDQESEADFYLSDYQ